MKYTWLREALLDLLRLLVLVCVGYASFVIGAICAAQLAYKLNGECGLPGVSAIIAGGLGGELAFRQGVYKSEFVKSVVFASVSLIVIVGPLATFSAIVHRDFETALRLIVGALGIGTIDGAICRIFLHHGRLRAFPAKSGIS